MEEFWCHQAVVDRIVRELVRGGIHQARSNDARLGCHFHVAQLSTPASHPTSNKSGDFKNCRAHGTAVGLEECRADEASPEAVKAKDQFRITGFEKAGFEPFLHGVS